MKTLVTEAVKYSNSPLRCDCRDILTQLIPFFCMSRSLAELGGVTLPEHTYKSLSCQLFFYWLYAALMFYAASSGAHTQAFTDGFTACRTKVSLDTWILLCLCDITEVKS